MSKFHDPHWIAFNGDPLTGKTPPRVDVFGPPMSDGEYGEAFHAYKLFCDCKNTMVGEFLSQDRTLVNGTRIHMTSTNGLDVVQVFTNPRKGGRPLDPSGYLTTPKDKNKRSGWNRNAHNELISASAHIAAAEQFGLPPKITLHSKYKAGWVSWIGAPRPNGSKPALPGIVLTYNHGGNNRYHTRMWDTVLGTNHAEPFGAEPNIYYRGTTIATEFGVTAAAIFGGMIVYITNQTLFYATSPINGIDEALARGEFRPRVNPQWTQSTPTGSVPDARRCSAYHFSPDGSKAACAVVTSTFGVFTWDYTRMHAEALPQSKRYINLTAALTAPFVTTAWSDATVTTEAITALFNGTSYLPKAIEAQGLNYSWSESGSLEFTGRRLWGIDYDNDGNEIEVTFRHAGSGSASMSYLNGAGSGSAAFSSAWGVYANEALIVEAYREFDSAGGAVESNFLAVHDLDARFKVAVVERLRMYGASIGSTHYPTMTVESTYQGALVHTSTVAMPPEVTFTASHDVGLLNFMGIRNAVSGGSMYRGGNSYVATLPGSGAMCVSYPMIQDWYGEQWIEAIFDASGFLTTRTHVDHLKGYPNQISDALLMMFGFEGVVLLDLGLFSQYGPSYSSDHIHLDAYPALMYYLADAVDDGDDVYETKRVHGFAQKHYDNLHHIIATKGTYFRGFANMMMKERETFLGGPSTYVAPTCSAGVYIRDAPTVLVPNPSFVRHDLMPSMTDKIENEVGVAVVDQPSFRIDPIRVL